MTLHNNGTPDDTSDDRFEWSYTVTSLDGTRCDLSFWVLSLCSAAYDAFVEGAPEPAFLVNPDPVTGLTGVKWDDIGSGFVSGTFTFVLDQSFAITQVTAGFKTGEGISFQDVEGPFCAPTPTPTPAVLSEAVSPATAPSGLPNTGGSDASESASGLAIPFALLALILIPMIVILGRRLRN